MSTKPDKSKLSSTAYTSTGAIITALLACISAVAVAVITNWGTLFPPSTPMFKSTIDPYPPTLETENMVLVEGTWEARTSLDTGFYIEFTQDSNNIYWDFEYLFEKGKGRIEDTKITLSWKNLLEENDALCEIVSIDNNNRARRIECDNGTIYTRLEKYPSIYQIDGTWEGIHPLLGSKTYTFSQEKLVFNWRIESINETGRGYIYSGKDQIYLAWFIGETPGLAICAITGKNANGYLTRFECDNGTVISRK